MVDVAAGKRARVGDPGSAGDASASTAATSSSGGSGGSGSSLRYSLNGFGRFILPIEDVRRVRRTSRV